MGYFLWGHYVEGGRGVGVNLGGHFGGGQRDGAFSDMGHTSSWCSSTAPVPRHGYNTGLKARSHAGKNNGFDIAHIAAAISARLRKGRDR